MRQAERRKYHYIYKITRNDGSGKYYIGMHSTDDLDDGYFGSGQLLWKSIKKYGKEVHTKEILEFLPSRKELAAREKSLVNEELLQDKKCMNISTGGEGGYAEKNKTNGFHRKGWEAMSAKVNRSVVAKKTWKLHYEKLKAARPKGSGKYFKNGNTPEALEKKKATFEKIEHQQGSKNSQFGTYWVHNVEGAKKIKREELDLFLKQGFTIGRAPKQIKPQSIRASSEKKEEYQRLQPLCRNSGCNKVLSFTQFRKSITSCSKACSNKTRYRDTKAINCA